MDPHTAVSVSDNTVRQPASGDDLSEFEAEFAVVFAAVSAVVAVSVVVVEAVLGFVLEVEPVVVLEPELVIFAVESAVGAEVATGAGLVGVFVVFVVVFGLVLALVAWVVELGYNSTGPGENYMSMLYRGIFCTDCLPVASRLTVSSFNVV